ncbi:MAG: ParB/RepB/Spo0J family partition protein [Phycisphaerales bacterium]
MKENRVHLVPINEVEEGSVQPRHSIDGDDLHLLVESARLLGILQPIIARRINGRLVIIDGHRRHRAAVLAGLTHIPVIIREDEISDADVSRQQLGSFCRQGLNAMDCSDAIHRLMSISGSTAKAVAREIGQSEGQVSKLLTLQLLADADKQRVRDGRLGMAAAYRLATGEGVSRTPRASGKAPVRRHAASRPRAETLRLRLGAGATIAIATPERVALDDLIAYVARLQWRLGRLRAEGSEFAAALRASTTAPDIGAAPNGGGHVKGALAPPAAEQRA